MRREKWWNSIVAYGFKNAERKLLESFRIVRKLEIQYNKFICFLIKQI